jgi:hypothetical protein
MGDQLHWATFRSEWVVSVFARFITDAHHRLIHWRLPPGVRESIQCLTVQDLLAESGYDVREAEQLLALEDGCRWEASGEQGTRELQAVPIAWVGREPRILEVHLPHEGNQPTADPRAHGWPRDPEVATALAEVDVTPQPPPLMWDGRFEEPMLPRRGQVPKPGRPYLEGGCANVDERTWYLYRCYLGTRPVSDLG